MLVLAGLFFLAVLKISSKIYFVLTKSLTELKKEHYNMNTVNIVRSRLSRFVGEDERHLYQ